MTEDRRKRLTLVACIVGSAIAFVDSTVVNVALPALRDDLDAGLATQQWVVEAYLLTLGSLLLVGGSLGDLLGRRRVFAIGVSAFGVTSLLCGLAPDGGTLIAARALQGVAGALLVPSTLAIVNSTFGEGERGAAIGSWTAWTSISILVGPPLGGALIDLLSWRAIFLINVPLVALTLWLIARAVPESSDPQAGRVDYPGAVLCALGLGLPVFGLIEQPREGWGDPLVAGALIAGGVFLAAFVLWERRTSHPMLDLRLFRINDFAVGNVATLLIYAGLGAMGFFLTLYVQQVAGYSATEAGLVIAPSTLVMFVSARRFGALAERVGPRLLMGIGPLVCAASMLWLRRVDASVDYVVDLLPMTLLFGLGLAITVAPLTATVLGAVEQTHAGVASGTNNAVARVAGLIAIAAVGAVIAGSFDSELDKRSKGIFLSEQGQAALADARTRPLAGGRDLGPEAQAARPLIEASSVEAFRLGMLVVAGLMVAGGIVSWRGIESRPRRRVATEPVAGSDHPCSEFPCPPVDDRVAAVVGHD